MHSLTYISAFLSVMAPARAAPAAAATTAAPAASTAPAASAAPVAPPAPATNATNATDSANAASARLFASVYNGTVDTLELATPASGPTNLTRTSSTVACGQSPSWLTLDKPNDVLYCSNEGQNPSGSLTSFNLSESSGALTQSAVVNTLGGDVNSGLFAYGRLAVADYGKSSISTFALPLSNSSQANQTFTFNMTAPGPNATRQSVPHPHQAILDPTGDYVFSPDLGADMIRIFSVNNCTGQLTPYKNFPVPAGSGPRHVAFFNPSGWGGLGTFMFVASELANTVTAYSVSYTGSNATSTPNFVCVQAGLSTMSITQIQGPIFPYPKNTPPTNSTSSVSEVHVHNNTLTVSNRGDQSFGPGQDSLAVYSIAPQNGSVTFQGSYPAGGSYPRTFAINAAGDRLAVGLQKSDAVAVYGRNPVTGALLGLLGNATLEGEVSSVVWDE